MSISTPLTKMLNIQHPILLAGMGKTSGAPLAAAVCNAGGLGVIGGVGYTPAQLAEMIVELKVCSPITLTLELHQEEKPCMAHNADTLIYRTY